MSNEGRAGRMKRIERYILPRRGEGCVDEALLRLIGRPLDLVVIKGEFPRKGAI
jgi:hypothetical protein